MAAKQSGKKPIGSKPQKTAANTSSSLGLFVVVLVLIILAAFFLYERPQNAKYLAAKQNLSTQQAQTALYKQQILNLTTKSSSVASSIENSYTYLKSLLPNGNPETTLITSVPEEVSTAGLTLNSFAYTAAATPATGVAPSAASTSAAAPLSVSFTTSVSGPIQNILNWVSNITTGTPLATLNNVVLDFQPASNNNQAMYTLTANLTFYYSAPTTNTNNSASTPTSIPQSVTTTTAAATSGSTGTVPQPGSTTSGSTGTVPQPGSATNTPTVPGNTTSVSSPTPQPSSNG